MSLWGFLSGWGSTIGAGAFVAKEVGSSIKSQVNFEVREQYRKKFFDEWVDEKLEAKLRDDLSKPSKYDEIWERIEKYKRDDGEVYLMRKLFGEKAGRRYFWGEVGEKRLRIRNANGKYPTGYTAKVYNENFWKTMSLLMNTYEKLTSDDAFYIFNICYNSIKRQYGVEVMDITFSRKEFRDIGKTLLACDEFDAEWKCARELEAQIERDYKLNIKTDQGYWNIGEGADEKFEEIWNRIEEYKRNNGKTCSYLLRLEELQRKTEQDTGEKIERYWERVFHMPLKDLWTNIGKRRLPLAERYGELLPGETYLSNMHLTLVLFVNTFDKMATGQGFIVEKYRRHYKELYNV